MLEDSVRDRLIKAARVAWRDMPNRAVRAATAVAGRLGISAPEAHALRSSFSIYVHLAPAPIVARVAVLTPILRDPIAPWLAREVAVTSFLADRRLPVVRPVNPDVHEHAGLFLTLWELADVVDGDPDPALVAQSLHDIHAGLHDVPSGFVTTKLTPLHDVEAVVRLGAQRTADQFAMLQPQLTSRTPDQVLHGDAHASNLLQSRHGWRWHDFEETCLGPVDWDLATMSRSRRIDGAAALRAYPDAPPYADLTPWVQLRELQVQPWEVLRTAVIHS